MALSESDMVKSIVREDQDELERNIWRASCYDDLQHWENSWFDNFNFLMTSERKSDSHRTELCSNFMLGPTKIEISPPGWPEHHRNSFLSDAIRLENRLLQRFRFARHSFRSLLTWPSLTALENRQTCPSIKRWGSFQCTPYSESDLTKQG